MNDRNILFHYVPPVEGHELRATEILKRLSAVEPAGVEVGVYTGAMSRELLLRHPLLALWMVDPWGDLRPSAEYKATKDPHAFVTELQHARFETQAEAAVEFAVDRHVILKMTSLAAAPLFKDGTLDFVFLDADHSYESVVKDIAAWWPKIKSGGMLGGHDYGNKWFPEFGVKQAVDEFAAGKRLELGEDLTWFVRRTDA